MSILCLVDVFLIGISYVAWPLSPFPLFNRYFNVIGSDPDGRLGEAPRPELRQHGRISGACFDAARGIIPGIKVHQILSLAAVCSSCGIHTVVTY